MGGERADGAAVAPDSAPPVPHVRLPALWIASAGKVGASAAAVSSGGRFHVRCFVCRLYQKGRPLSVQCSVHMGLGAPLAAAATAATVISASRRGAPQMDAAKKEESRGP